MKKNLSFKIKIPKKILCLPLLTNFFVILIMSILLFGLFLSLSLLEGIKINIKNNLTRNYISHTRIYSPQHNTNPKKQISSWWLREIPTAEQTQNQSQVRAVTTRSILPVIFSNNTQQQSLELTMIRNSDGLVFDPFISKSSNTIIALDRVLIGREFAKTFNLTNGQSLPIYIPALNLYYTNLIIDHIFDAPDHFKNRYSIYINKESLTNIEEKFQTYNFRFTATPFISITESTIKPLFLGQKIENPDEILEYQYSQLNTMKTNIHKWIYFFYALCGLLLLLLHFLAFTDRQPILDSYTYKTGFIPKLSPLTTLFFTLTGKIFLITLLASLGIIGFLFLPIVFDSTLFTLKEALYPQYILPIMYFFPAKIPWTLLNIIPIAIIIGISSAGITLFALQLLPNFSNPKNNVGYILLGMIVISFFGFFSSYEYIEANFFKQSRNHFWGQEFFGDYMVSDTDYHSYKSLDLIPNSITIPLDYFNIFNEQEIRYMATLEYQGQALAITNNPSTNIEPLYKTKDIYIKSMTGNLAQFTEILDPLKNNQVVIGKEIADYFLTNKIMTISLVTSTMETIEFPVIVATVVDHPIGEFNNTVFINHTNLTGRLQYQPTQFTKLQISGNKKLVTPLETDKIKISTLKQNTKYWNHLSDLVIASMGISTIIQGIYFAFFVLAIILYLSIDKTKILVYDIWGTFYNPQLIYSLWSLASFIFGIIYAWLILLFRSIWTQELPTYMNISNLTKKTISMIPDWTTVPVLILIFSFCFFISYRIFQYIFKRIKKQLVKNHYKDRLS